MIDEKTAEAVKNEIELIKDGEISCAVIKDGRVVKAMHGNGMCPMEQSVLNTSSGEEALSVLREKILMLKRGQIDDIP